MNAILHASRQTPLKAGVIRNAAGCGLYLLFWMTIGNRRIKFLMRSFDITVVERAGEVEVNAAAVVSAVTAYARLNSHGELIERAETVDLNSLFERMRAQEFDEYARCGTLPDWFEHVVAKGAHGRIPLMFTSSLMFTSYSYTRRESLHWAGLCSNESLVNHAFAISKSATRAKPHARQEKSGSRCHLRGSRMA